MTTITIEQSLLEQALNALLLPCDRWNKQQFLIVKGAIESLNAALVAPAAAPEFPADWAQMIHYPECWDTAAYPELRDAIHEALAWSGCSVCKPATAPERKPCEVCGGTGFLAGRFPGVHYECKVCATKAQPATAPAWNNVPTVPGVWVNRVSMRAMEIDASVLKAWGKADVRWYGPIPPDGDKP